MALRMASQRWKSSPLVETVIRSARQQQIRTLAREHSGRENHNVFVYYKAAAESPLSGPETPKSPLAGPETPKSPLPGPCNCNRRDEYYTWGDLLFIAVCGTITYCFLPPFYSRRKSLEKSP